jgi:hypothetical protein
MCPSYLTAQSEFFDIRPLISASKVLHCRSKSTAKSSVIDDQRHDTAIPEPATYDRPHFSPHHEHLNLLVTVQKLQ